MMPPDPQWYVVTAQYVLTVATISAAMVLGAIGIVVVGFLVYLFCGGHRHDTETSTRR